METFAEASQLVDNPHYQEERRRALSALNDGMIDAPIVDVIRGLNALPYCFTLQSCYGHFMFQGQEDPHNLEPLPRTGVTGPVQYRIAYTAFCLENSPSGAGFLEALGRIAAIDPENIQLCSPQWFWERQVNSCALQVEPERFKDRDTATVEYREALRIESTRNEFFVRLRQLVQSRRGRGGGATTACSSTDRATGRRCGATTWPSGRTGRPS